MLPSLFHANLPARFWEASAHHSLISYNLTPTRANPGKTCPASLWKSQQVSYTNLRAFGCKCFRKITGPSYAGKLANKANPCLHLYSLPDGDGWMVWDLHLSKQVKTHDVIFLEEDFPGLGVTSKRTHQDWFSWYMDGQDKTSDHRF